MCNPTQQPPRRDMYELESTIRTGNGPFLLPNQARRWVYQGIEKHYGYRYHLWQNVGTKKKFAWEVEGYRQAATTNTKETA